MSNGTKLSKTLSKIFTNPNFMAELVKNGEFDANISVVLKYYIATRDEVTSYSFEEIRKLYEDFMTEHSDIARDNTVTHGFLTHAFNGYKRERIEKYGLDYEGRPELAEEIEYGRSIMRELEEILEKSIYTAREEDNNKEKNVTKNTVFMCTPGREISGFALRFSPERLFLGPLKGRIDPVVGETKEQAYYRLAEKRLKEKYKDPNSEMYKKGLEVAKKVVEFYCSKRPGIALIDIDKILDVPLWSGFVDKNQEMYMRDVIRREYSPDLEYFYEDHGAGLSGNSLYNLVTHASNIPQDAVSTFEIMDAFELEQLQARGMGLKPGQKVDGRGRATIGVMRTIVKNLTSIDDLENLKTQVALRQREDLLPELEKQKKRLEEFSLPSNFEEAQEYYDRLIAEEEAIYSRPFRSREGVKPQKSLKEVIEGLKKSGDLDEILEMDDIIKQDPAQYQSYLHGASHTRRVAFFAKLIAKEEKIDFYDRKLLLEIAKNHDIGRVHDYEDKEHGANSVSRLLEMGPDRLNSWTEGSIEVLKFIITHHSLSKRENEEAIKELKENEEILQNAGTVAWARSHLKEIKDGSRPYDIKAIKFLYGEDFDFEGLTQEKLDEMVQEVDKKREEIREKYPLLKYKKVNDLEHLLKCFKDADKLDRVRLSPNGLDLHEGLDASRLLLDSSKGLEGLAYESLDKLLRVLDIERERKELELFLGLNRELSEVPLIEAEISDQMEYSRRASEERLSGIVEQSAKKVDIREIPGKIKEFFKGFFTKKEKTQELDDSNGER